MSGYPVICDCGAEVWLRGFNGGYRGTCPNCNADVVYWCGEYIPPEPEPEDMHLIVRKYGEDEYTWKFTNKAGYFAWLKAPDHHWSVTETDQTEEIGGVAFKVGVAHRLPTVAVRDGDELRTFLSAPEMDTWALRNYKTVEYESTGQLGGKTVHFFKVIA